MPNNKFCPKTELLLVDESNKKVKVSYASNCCPFKLPLISPRPPYYCNPQYKKNCPLI